MTEDEFERRQKLRSILYQYDLCGSDPDKFMDELEREDLMVIQKPAPEEPSNLVEHARIELERIGEEPETIEGYLRIVRAFISMGHSGGSASVAIPVIYRLLQYKNLAPLTNDPDEWIHHKGEDYGTGTDLWQNKRCSAAISEDGGKTYYLVSELPHRCWRHWRAGKKIYKTVSA